MTSCKKPYEMLKLTPIFNIYTVSVQSSIFVYWHCNQIFLSKTCNGYSFQKGHMIGASHHYARTVGQHVSAAKFLGTNALLKIFPMIFLNSSWLSPAFSATSNGILIMVSVSRLSSSHCVAFTRGILQPF